MRARSQIRQQDRPTRRADRVESDGRERRLVKGSQLRHGGGDCVVRVPMAAVIERERGFNRRDCLVVQKNSSDAGSLKR